MPEIKITDLTDYTAPGSSDALPIVDVPNDVTKKVSLANLLRSVPVGSAAAPGLAFLADTNTGFYSPASDTLAAATAGLIRWNLSPNGYMTGNVNGLGAGLYPAQQYYRRNTTLAGSDSTAAQSLLGAGVTLVAATVYEFEILFALSKASGTTHHTLALGFGGTATLNNISYQIIYRSANNTSFPLAAESSAMTNFIESASASVISGSFGNSSASHHGLIKGTVSIDVAGTFIPQYTLSAAPGGGYSTQIGSYMKIAPIGAAGAISQGTWA